VGRRGEERGGEEGGERRGEERRGEEKRREKRKEKQILVVLKEMIHCHTIKPHEYQECIEHFFSSFPLVFVSPNAEMSANINKQI
jgi:hypothetical protein